MNWGLRALKAFQDLKVFMVTVPVATLWSGAPLVLLVNQGLQVLQEPKDLKGRRGTKVYLETQEGEDNRVLLDFLVPQGLKDRGGTS